MDTSHTRRDLLKGSLAIAGLAALGVPEWMMPVLRADETLVPFTDIPENVQYDAERDRAISRYLRTIDGPLTPKDQFFTTQHYGHPVVDPAAFRLKISGLVDRPNCALARRAEARWAGTELVAGFECSGNRRAACKVWRVTDAGPACRCALCSTKPA